MGMLSQFPTMMRGSVFSHEGAGLGRLRLGGKPSSAGACATVSPAVIVPKKVRRSICSLLIEGTTAWHTLVATASARSPTGNRLEAGIVGDGHLRDHRHVDRD